MNNSQIKILSLSLLILAGIGFSLLSQFNQYELYINSIVHSQKNGVSSLKIKYFDEVLTMSARMSAYTGDEKWLHRYNEFVVKLADELNAVEKKDNNISTYIDTISFANDKLIGFERTSFALVKEGDLQTAQRLLESKEYDKYKQEYASAQETLLMHLDKDNHETIQKLTTNYQQNTLITLLILGFVILFGGYLIYLLTKLNKKLSSQARTDPLTKLYNRRYSDQYLQQEVERAKRYKSETFSIILLDIDFFKEVNDKCGHDIGDEILVKVANILQENTRNVDITCRWGGEEFLIILPEANEMQAKYVAEKIRKYIAQFDFCIKIKITVSLGVVEYEKGISRDDLIKKADIFLYKAKEQGRNQTVSETHQPSLSKS